MQGEKQLPGKDEIMENQNLSDSSYLNDYSIISSPLWKRVSAYIEKERYFINLFKDKKLTEVMNSRVNITLHRTEELKHEILLAITDEQSEHLLNLHKESYSKAHSFKLEIESFAKDNKVNLNDDETNNEITRLKLDIDNGLNKASTILNGNLSKNAIKIRDEVNEKDKLPYTVVIYALRKYLEHRMKGESFETPVKENASEYGRSIGLRGSGINFYNWYTSISNSNGTGKGEYRVKPDDMERLKDILLAEDVAAYHQLNKYEKNGWKDE